MPTAPRDLFRYAARFVTPADVSAFAPSDPGYHNYVRAFHRILASGDPPRRASFDLTEAIGLTRWVDAGREKDPVRFRRFRAFTNAVGVALCVAGDGQDDSLPANYLAIGLIDDARTLDDRDLLALLGPAFAELHERLAATGSAESAYLSLGQLLVGTWLGVPDAERAALAVRATAEAAIHAGHASDEFFWGGTLFAQLHAQWRSHASAALATSSGEVARFRGSLLRGGPPVRR